MKKKLIESFIGSVVILTAVVAITYWLGHYDVTLRLVLLDILVVLFGAGLMTLIEYCLLKKNNIIKTLAALALGAMLLTGCSTKHKAVVEEAYIFVPTLNIGGGMTPTETEVSRMPDSLFDGRPHIIADSSLYALSARQIALLQTFNNPNAVQIIKLIESIDDVLRQSGDTITTREALMSYYHNFDLLDQMTGTLTPSEQEQLQKLLE